MTALFNLDASILLWIQANLRGALDGFFIVVTHLGDAGILWIILTIIMMCVRKTRRTGVTCAISMILGMIAVNLILKNWIARIRPYELIEGLTLMIEKQVDYSFPSGHAANSFACAWVMLRTMKKRWGVPALLLAALIAFSRLYVGVHYPSDILAGILIGIAAAEAAIVIVRGLRRKFPAFRRFTRKKPSRK